MDGEKTNPINQWLHPYAPSLEPSHPGEEGKLINISLNSNTLATSSEELTHWKRPWCWEGLGGEEGDDRGWDGWTASLTQWTWLWVNSGSWWWTGRPGVLRFMGSKRVGHHWAIELNWTEALKSFHCAWAQGKLHINVSRQTWFLSCLQKKTFGHCLGCLLWTMFTLLKL